MATTELARVYDLRHRGQAYRARVAQIGPNRHRVTIDGVALELVTRRLGSYERRLELAGAIHRTVVSRQGDDLLVEVDGVPHRISRGDIGRCATFHPRWSSRSPSPSGTPSKPAMSSRSSRR